MKRETRGSWQLTVGKYTEVRGGILSYDLRFQIWDLKYRKQEIRGESQKAEV